MSPKRVGILSGVGVTEWSLEFRGSQHNHQMANVPSHLGTIDLFLYDGRTSTPRRIMMPLNSLN